MVAAGGHRGEIAARGASGGCVGGEFVGGGGACGGVAAGASAPGSVGWTVGQMPTGDFSMISVGADLVCGVRPNGGAECWAGGGVFLPNSE